jgi:hypothetical protein
MYVISKVLFAARPSLPVLPFPDVVAEGVSLSFAE